MTKPRPETLEREKDKLYLNEAELIRRIGVPEHVMKPVLHELVAKHKTTGFPQKSRLFGDRWYWPKVEAWLDRNEGLLNLDAPPAQRERHG